MAGSDPVFLLQDTSLSPLDSRYLNHLNLNARNGMCFQLWGGVAAATVLSLLLWSVSRAEVAEGEAKWSTSLRSAPSVAGMQVSRHADSAASILHTLPNPEDLGIDEPAKPKPPAAKPKPPVAKPIAAKATTAAPKKSKQKPKFEPRINNVATPPPQAVAQAPWRAGSLVPEGWDQMSTNQRAWELWAGKYGALFWMNSIGAWGSMLLLLGWVFFRFIGPSLGLYELQDGPSTDIAPMMDFTPPRGYQVVVTDDAQAPSTTIDPAAVPSATSAPTAATAPAPAVGPQSEPDQLTSLWNAVGSAVQEKNKPSS